MTERAKSKAKGKAKSWRDVLPIHPAAELFPLMTPDELKALGEDIKNNGQQSPVTLWRRGPKDHHQLLDGRNRLDAMEMIAPSMVSPVRNELHPCISTRTAPPETDPYAFVLSANIHRRHLTAEQRRELITKVLKAQPGKSNRTIAKLTKVDHKTVGAVRDKLEGRGEIPHVSVITDTKGRLQPTDKRARQQAKAERRAIREAKLAARITALPNKKYGVIVADPEWRFEPWSRETGMDRAADNHYPTSPTEIIAARDVSSIAADHCVLFLWATQPMLSQALSVMTAWGFTLRSHAVWAKDKSGSGTGYWFRNKHETLLVGVKGDVPAPAPGTQWESLIHAPVAGHSVKPERFLEMVEAYFPTVPKIELNRRGPPRPGWDAWGNEVEAIAADDLEIPTFLDRNKPVSPAAE